MAVIEYDEYKQKLQALEPTLRELEKALGIPKDRQELKNLQAETEQEGFWNNIEHSQKVSQQIKRLEHRIKKYDRLVSEWEAVILATGGVSYPGTGSTGDGYRMAAALGHGIVPPCGSLVPLVSDDGDCRRMQGLALKNVELTALNGKNKVQFRDFGELLFTHFGVSGPLVLSASAHLRHWDREKYRLCIDLKPALDRDKLEARILRDLGENPNRDFEKIVAGLVPHSMVPVLLDRLEVPAGLKANSVTRQQRRALEELLKCFSVSVTGPRPVAEAIVTSGGVQVSQVQPSTMESKLAPGLYFAGEILDVDAYTGGFNLQIAWSTGHLAGTSAAGAEGE